MIPTIGKATLYRAILSVICQELKQAEYEVIVVNASGYPLSKTGWEQSERVHTIETNRHERSIARNSGAAVARSDYLIFLDDDDWLLPGALDSFWFLAGYMAGFQSCPE
jgi:glycosyltransferase involved in cell wall biosynthesis